MNKKYAGVDFRIISMLGLFCFAFLVHITAQEVNNDYKIRTVVIDAGHGGKDPGSVGKQTSEKHVVLAIALKLGEYIEQYMPDIKVVYTRKTDEFIPLHQRAEIANTSKADLFISIHANGNTDHNAYGTETLLLGYHRAGENFEVAKQENSVILLEEDYSTTYEGFDPNAPESYIMFSLMQERFFERSMNFAALVQDQFRDRAKRKDRGVYRQGLLVLARTAMPGVLIETGFITNPDEEAYLITERGQDLIASAIFRAFRDYKDVVESKSYFAATSKTMDLSLSSETNTTEPPASDEQQNDEVKDSEVTRSGVTIDDSIVSGSKVSGDSPAGDMIADGAGAGGSLRSIEFKVQVTASSKSIPLNAPLFEGLEKVSEFKVDGLFKYAVGSSPTFEEIMTYSGKVRERFPDAFIIGIKDGTIIPLNEALAESQQNLHKN
ncbi:MAG: N-acetylmuramoyl-L-alanine amidase [Bacteroidales bacterium]|nr:N-acetylmuramoyl-L-alanine amidase [Bacteroidales bacterium]